MATVEEIAEAVAQKMKSQSSEHNHEHIEEPFKVNIDGDEYKVCKGCGKQIEEDDEDDE